MRKETLWEAKRRENPGHSQWYIHRFEAMRAEGADLDGEARLIDAMLPRGARVLDAGCGPGRVGGALADRGHRVVGVDIDPELIDAARREHPGADWLVGDLAELDLTSPPSGTTPGSAGPAAAARGAQGGFDLIVCAGNVMTFLAPGTGVEVLSGFRAHLVPGGRAVVGFGADRGYDPADFLADARAAGLEPDGLFSSWQLHPYPGDTGFLVAILSRPADRTGAE